MLTTVSEEKPAFKSPSNSGVHPLQRVTCKIQSLGFGSGASCQHLVQVRRGGRTGSVFAVLVQSVTCPTAADAEGSAQQCDPGESTWMILEAHQIDRYSEFFKSHFLVSELLRIFKVLVYSVY